MADGDRIWKVNTGKYDQVIALTQHMINEGLVNLYRKLELDEEEGLKLPPPFGHDISEDTWMADVEFGSPRVLVDGTPGNMTAAKYLMRIKKGKASFLIKYIPGDKKTRTPGQKWVAEYIMDNWSIVYPVNLNFLQVDKNTPRGAAIDKRMKEKGVDTADHSIYELMLDLGSMSTSDATVDIGTWNEEDWVYGPDLQKDKNRPAGWELGKARSWTDQPKDAIADFEVLIKKCKEKLDEAGLITMGYALKTENTNKKATFEVTNVRYQTYPWRDPSTGKEATPAVSLTGDSRLNYLLYLETVQPRGKPRKEPPASADAFLNVNMGNWTNGRTPGNDGIEKFGTFVLTYENFMEGYFLPKVHGLNKMLQVDVQEAFCQSHAKFLAWDATIRINANLGQTGGRPDSDFEFKKGTLSIRDDWHENLKEYMRPLTTADAGDVQLVWEDVEWGPTAKHDYSHSGSVETWASGDTITFSRILIKPGSNTFKLEGRTWTKLEFKIDPSIVEGKWYGGFICRAKWSLTFRFEEVTDGGLRIDIQHEKPEIDFPWKPAGPEDLPNAESALRTGYATAGTNFQYFVNDLTNCLQGQDKFVFPASGVYFFKNPTFNARGDLITDLAYNGNPERGNFNPNAGVERTEQPVGKYTDLPATPADEKTRSN